MSHLFFELIVFGVHFGVFEDGFVFPEFEGGFELARVFSFVALVVGFLDPGFENFSVTF